MHYFVISLLASLSHTRAAPICLPTRSQIAGPKAISSLVLKTAVIDDADRRTASRYAEEHNLTKEEVERRYAASGDLLCGTQQSQAQLVLKDNLIVTAAHSLFPTLDCKTKIKPQACKVTFQSDKGPQTYEVENIVNTGVVCPPKPACPPPYCKKFVSYNQTYDWAILKLRKSVDPSVKPYRIAESDKEKPRDDMKITATGKSSDFNPTHADSISKSEKHFGDCRIRHIDDPFKTTIIESDCDSATGFSGGALLSTGPDPALLAIHLGRNKGEDKSCIFPKNSEGPYVHECWASDELAVNEHFRDALVAVRSGNF